MKQWYIRLRSGNFENGYYEVGNNFDLCLMSAQDEFKKDCVAQGFTPMFAELVYSEQNDI